MVKIKAAASMLGVTPQTVRNWVAAGLLPAVRHPLNGYRLFQIEDIESLVASAKSDDRIGSKPAPPVGKEAGSAAHVTYAKKQRSGTRTLVLPCGQVTT